MYWCPKLLRLNSLAAGTFFWVKKCVFGPGTLPQAPFLGWENAFLALERCRRRLSQIFFCISPVHSPFLANSHVFWTYDFGAGQPITCPYRGPMSPGRLGGGLIPPGYPPKTASCCIWLTPPGGNLQLLRLLRRGRLTPPSNQRRHCCSEWY